MLLDLFLPLSLAFIMFSLGLGLTVPDFARVALAPKAFVAGFGAQVVALPIVAYLLCLAFGLSGEIALGVMILSICPGGVTSNMMTRLAGGDVALSISLTGVVSLLAVLTAPPLVALWAQVFMGETAPPVNVTTLALSMAAITAVPVILGMIVRRFAGSAADGLERWANVLATLLFVVIVVGALAVNWDAFIANLPRLGPLLALMVAVLFAIGWAAGAALSLGARARAALSVEAGIQNGTLGITIGALITATGEALPVLSIPSAVYGILMYVVGVPIVLALRRYTAAERA